MAVGGRVRILAADELKMTEKRPQSILIDDKAPAHAAGGHASKCKALCPPGPAPSRTICSHMACGFPDRFPHQWALLRRIGAVSRGFRGGAGYGVVRHYDWCVFLTGQSPAVFL